MKIFTLLQLVQTMRCMVARAMLVALGLFSLTACGQSVTYQQETRPLTITFDYTLNPLTALPGSFWRDTQNYFVHAAWSADGTLMATNGQWGPISIWDMAKRKVIHTFSTTSLIANEHYMFTLDGKYFVMIDSYAPKLELPNRLQSQRIRFFDARTFESVWEIDDCHCYSLGITPDSRKLYVQKIELSIPAARALGHGNPFSIYDIQTRQEIGKTDFPDAFYSCGPMRGPFLTDMAGNFMVTACGVNNTSGTIVVIDFLTNHLKELNNPGYSAIVAVSHDGKLMVASEGSGDFGLLPMRKWLLQESKPVAEFGSATKGKNVLAFSNDGHYLFVGEAGPKGRVLILNSDSGNVYANIDFNANIWQVLPSPSGKDFAVIADGVMKLFKISAQ